MNFIRLKKTRTSNHRYSRRRTENEENGPLSQEMMTQQMNLTQGSMSQTGLSQGISQETFNYFFVALFLTGHIRSNSSLHSTPHNRLKTF